MSKSVVEVVSVRKGERSRKVIRMWFVGWARGQEGSEISHRYDRRDEWQAHFEDQQRWCCHATFHQGATA